MEDEQCIAELFLVAVAKHSEPSIYQGVMVMNTLELVSLLIESGQAVAWTVHDAQKLWKAKNEVDELWDEEEHHGLAEVSQNAHHGERHASAVAESVTHKHFRREAVLLEESQGAKKEWDHDGKGVHMVLMDLRGVGILWQGDFDDVVNYDKAADDEALSDLKSIDSSINVDSVSAENGNVSHVEVVQKSQVHVAAKYSSQKLGHHH